MSIYEEQKSNRLYFSIIQGEFALQVPEGTPNARARKWEAGGKSGIKHEIVYRSISGKIVGVNFYQGENDGGKFTNLNLVLDEDEGGKSPVISVGIDTKYCKDILKKLPKIDLEEDVKIRPFSFRPDGEDNNVIGVEILQRDGTGAFNKKITSFFHKKEGDKWVSTNGFPKPEGNPDDYTSDDWKIYGISVKKFLVQYTEENVIPKLKAASEEKGPKEDVEYPKDENAIPEDIPF